MAYEVPRQWAHGDVPTGALMQRYSNSLNALKPLVDTYSRKNQAGWVQGDDSKYMFVHVHRWLFYTLDDGSGNIYDPDFPDNSATLSETDAESEGNYYRFDLSGLPWLYPGKMYRVDGVDGCFEHWMRECPRID